MSRSTLAFALSVLVTAPALAQMDARECDLTETGKISLPDAGGLWYRRVDLTPEYATTSGGPEWRQAGLYGGGEVVRPAAHAAAGVSIAEGIVPINGKIVMLSIGMSNTYQEFGRFRSRAMNDPARNPDLEIINAAIGSAPADAWDEVDDGTWDQVDSNLASNGLTPDQVQVAWIKHAVRSPMFPPLDFPTHPETVQVIFENVIKSLKARYPNCKLAFVSSRTRAYNSNQAAQSPEPASYEGGFAMQWMIERQIAGDPDLAYTGANPPAPWLSWGPYLWTDGMGAPEGDPPSPFDARSDGMVWTCSDVDRDGVHPSPPTPGEGDPAGEFKVGDQLAAFFLTDAASTPWFLRSTVGGPALVSLTANGTDVSDGGPLVVTAPATVNFASVTTGAAATSWTYGDGTFSYNAAGTTDGPAFDDNPSPTKVFHVPGTYPVVMNARDAAGNSRLATVAVVVQDGILSTPAVDDGPRRPLAAPHPLRVDGHLIFSLDRPGTATVSVHDVAGRRLADSVTLSGIAGENRVRWADVAGSATGAGVYLVVVDTPDGRSVDRVVVASNR